ncbi:MAG: universal stress protein, partial [Bacteroidota bacterium]
PDFEVKRVVFASDFTVESVPVYQKALKLFRTWDTKVHLVYINLPHVKFKSTREIKQETDAFLRIAHHGEIPEDIKVDHINDYTVEEGLYYYAEDRDANLIALPTHGRQGLAHFFQGSIGEDLANRAGLPVMTFKM